MIPEFFDIHSHVNFVAFDSDREATVKRALDGGVWFCNVGTQQDTSRKAIEIAEKYEKGVYAIIGLHPIHTGKSYHDEKELGEGGKEFTSRGEIFDTDIYRAMVKHPKVVAIGECGLDYYREDQDSGFKIQEQVFRKHIELAIEANKPLMLHVRNGSGRSAYRDALSILQAYKDNQVSSIKGNFHFFAGSWEEAREILDFGFNLSFTGVVTFTHDYDEVIRNTPIDRIMTETDSPYVSPAPHRGKRNEPLYVKEVVKAISIIKKTDFDSARKALISNAFRFFGMY